MGKPSGEGGWPDAGDAVESGDSPKCASTLAIRHDSPGDRRADSRQPRQLLGAGAVDINSLLGTQRRRQEPDRISVSLRAAVPGGIEQGKRGNRIWRRSRHRRAHQVAGSGQANQKGEGATFLGGHPRRMPPIPGRGGGYFFAERSTATATFPTASRLATESLSGVSLAVCQAGYLFRSVMMSMVRIPPGSINGR